MSDTKFTLQQFKERYHNDDACLEEVFQMRYGKDVCPKCNAFNSYKRIRSISKVNKTQRKSYQCTCCGNQIYPLAGTIFEKTRTPLTYWFTAIFLMTNTRNGVAAKELQRMLGVTYKCAFRMGHHIRFLMSQDGQDEFSGVVQMDEAYIGGSVSNKHRRERKEIEKKGSMWSNKIKLLGIVEENNRAHVRIVESLGHEEILSTVKNKVKEGSTIVTDGANPFGFLPFHGYTHIHVRHAYDEWVVGKFHTNTIEGFWSQLKRMIHGTHIKVSKRYLQRYVDECCFRYEHRHSQVGMFNAMVNRIS